MNLFTAIFGKTRTATKPRTILGLNVLEAREVPAAAMLDLSTVGSAGVLNGAIFQQYNANPQNGAIQSFLRLDQNGHEQGYNTNARPLQYDESSNKNLTHAIKVSDLPVANVSGVEYAQLVLDVNEPAWQPMISLDALQIFVSSNAKLNDYNAKKDTLDGLSAVYNMDTTGNRWVKIDANLNRSNGGGDVIVDIPLSDLPATTKGKDNYMYLYSHFGNHFGAGGKYEEWGVFPQQSNGSISPPPASPPPASPPPVQAETATINGLAQFLFGDGSTQADGFDTIFFVDQSGNMLTDADGNNLPSVTTDENGNFTGLITPAITTQTTFYLQAGQGSNIVAVTVAPGGTTNATLDLTELGSA